MIDRQGYGDKRAAGPVASGLLVQRKYTEDGAFSSGTTAIPADDTIPQSNEGDEFMSLAFTPLSSGNRLRIRARVHISNAPQSRLAAALFKDSETDATAVTAIGTGAASVAELASIEYEMDAGTTSEITFKVRAGGASGTTYFNGEAAARRYGGKFLSTIIIEEFLP